MNKAFDKIVIFYVTSLALALMGRSVVNERPAQQVRFSVSVMYTSTEYDDDARYGVLEHTMIILESNGTLWLLKTHGNASSRILAITHLEKQPDELRYFELEGSVYITTIYRNSLTACAYTYRPGRKLRHKCTTPAKIMELQHQTEDPKTLNVPDDFAVSQYIDDAQRPHVFMVIFDPIYKILWPYNLLNGWFEDGHELPPNCTCHPSNCFTDVNNTKGQVVINCASREQYLHQIDHGDFLVIGPAPVQQVTVGNAGLAVMTKHWEELNQDFLIVSNITSEKQYAKFLPITSFPASPTDKHLLPDGAVIISTNGSGIEIVCFIEPQKNKISCLTLMDDLNVQPIPMGISIPTDIVNASAINGLRGGPNLLAAEVESFNGSKYILQITAELFDPDLETAVSPSHSVPTVIYKNSNGSVSQGTSTRATQGVSIPPTDAVIGDNTTPPDVATVTTSLPDLNANASTPTVDTSTVDGASLHDCKLQISIAVVATAGLTLVIGIKIACFIFCRSQACQHKRYTCSKQ